MSKPRDRTEREQRGRTATGSADTTSTIERLTRRLSKESDGADALVADLQQLREQIASLENNFARQLADARARAEAAETTLADQKERLNALGRGREETMLALSEARAELARLKRERDQLGRDLASVENMQTTTMTLPEEDLPEAQAVIHALPSVEELMASLHSLAAAEADAAAARTGSDDALAAEDEMISPALVFPEGVDDGPDEAAQPRSPRSPHGNSKMLVFVDTDPPIKYPLFNEVTTIGRSETADIRVDGDYISRVHARIVLTPAGAVIEDLASTNGIKVNFKPADRRQLRHGDILSLGKLHFTFIDTETGAAD